jgi:hypothetical protein
MRARDTAAPALPGLLLLTYMWCDRRHVSSRQVPVNHPAVVASVQAAHATNVHHEHGSTQHMARTVWGDLQQATQQQTQQAIRQGMFRSTIATTQHSG